MKKILTIVSILTVASSLFSVRASAQDKFQSGFFLDNYNYSYRLNPAIMSEKSFFGLGTGNVEVGISSGLGISSLIYPNAAGDGLVTFLHPSVSTDEMMTHLGKDNPFAVDANVNILSTGKRKENAFNSFEINLRSEVGTSLPGDLFRFLKEGNSDTPYDLSQLFLSGKLYAEVAIGVAKRPADGNLTVGFRVKGLIGLANADIRFDKADVYVNNGILSTDIEGRGRLALGGGQLYNDEQGKLQVGYDQTKIGPAGYGGAVDIGFRWTPFESLAISGGVNDLGGIFWKYNSIAKATDQFTFNGLGHIGGDTDYDKEWEKVGEDFMDIANLQVMEGLEESAFERLAFTANLGARLRLPVLSFISVGANGVYHFDDIAPYWDARAGLTVSPLRFISVTANYGQNTQGKVLGVAASVTLLFLNAYVGLDTYADRVGIIPIEGVQIPTYEGIPVPIDPFRCKLNFGVSMQFGQRYRN
ncbi:MAG: hypothetical protein IKS71_04230 [Bacteroidales bacterium]|nr:hypothetical protein [Bacteroidales bacterium]